MRFPALTSCLPRLEGIAWRATSSRSIAAGVTIMPLKSAGTPSSAMSCSARFRHHLAADTDHDQPEDGQGRCLPKRLPLFLALSHSFGEEKLPVARDANQVHHCTDKGQEQNHPCPSWGEGAKQAKTGEQWTGCEQGKNAMRKSDCERKEQGNSAKGHTNQEDGSPKDGSKSDRCCSSPASC